jgi:peroxiredoxin/mono/diheme cytochrome c family protein
MCSSARLLRLVVLPALLLGLSGRAGAAAPPPPPPGVVPDLRLQAVRGKGVRLHGLKGKQAVVLAFVSLDCPMSLAYTAALNELARRYGPRGVAFLAVWPTTDDPARLAREAKEAGLELPLFRDGRGEAAGALGARVTPEVFVLDAGFRVRYRGRIDDGYAARLKKKPAVTREDLRLALEDVLSGRAVAVGRTEAFGCPVRQTKPPRQAGKVVFYRDVLPILQKRCQACHRPGEVAPFALMNYRQAVHWADDVKHYTRTRQMPPWKPSAGHAFVGERKLTAKEIDTLAAWVDGGTPAGDPRQAPPAEKFTDGWQLGKPDLVLEPPGEMTIGPSGPDLFRSFVFSPALAEDKYVIAYEVRPGNPRVVHHTLHFLDDRGRGRRLQERERRRVKGAAERDRGPGYSSRMGPGFFPPSGDVGGWAPGERPVYFPDGVAFHLPRGNDVVVQVHYHRTGRVEKDRTRVGLYFARKPAARPIQGLIIPGLFVSIPAGAADYRVSGSLWVAQDCKLVTITPHMHLLGKRIQITMTPPGGKPEVLLAVDEWDYNWQETYYFKNPPAVKAGTRLRVEGVFDNSAANPNNPSSPPRRVFLGEETTNEMCFGFLGVTTDRPGVVGFRLFPGGPVLRRPGTLPGVKLTRGGKGP